MLFLDVFAWLYYTWSSIQFMALQPQPYVVLFFSGTKLLLNITMYGTTSSYIYGWVWCVYWQQAGYENSHDCTPIYNLFFIILHIWSSSPECFVLGRSGLVDHNILYKVIILDVFPGQISIDIFRGNQRHYTWLVFMCVCCHLCTKLCLSMPCCFML